MSKLIGKIKNEYKNILHHNTNIIDDVDITTFEIIDFRPNYKPDEDELFRIINFSNTDYFIDQCSENFSTSSINQIRNEDYKDISVLVIIQNGKKYFQRITPSFYVNRKTFLNYDGQPRIVEHQKQIEIKEESDAVYVESTDTLYFRDISKLKSIFPGIEELHREATQEEVDRFVSNDFIALVGLESTRIGVNNRKRIADIGTKYNKLTSDKKQSLIMYAIEKSGVEIEDGMFLIKSENHLKKVLYAMDQRYYYADIYDENRMASSVRVI